MEATRRRAANSEGEEVDDLTEEVVGLRTDAEAPAGVTAYVALGSNLGERIDSLREAVRLLGAREGIRVSRLSPVYESEAHTLPGQAPQPAFLNAVAAISTTLEAGPLLAAMLSVESGLGRRREGRRWEARPIDLDLILFGERVIQEPGLTVPHPRLGERRFVLVPLLDLAPEVVVPGTGRTVTQLLATCADATPVVRTDLVLG